MADDPDQASPLNPPVPATQKPPRRRGRRVLYVLLAIVAVLVIVVSLFPTLLSLSIGKDRILALASRSIHAPVEAEALSLSWLGKQTLTRLRVGAPQGFSPAEDVLRVERITLQRGLLGLIFSGGAAIEIEKPVLTVRRNTEGVFNFEALGGRRTARTKGDAPAPGPGRAPGGTEPRSDRAQLPPSLFSIAIHEGAVTYHDDALGTAAEVRAIDAEATLGPEGAALQAGAEVRHPGAGTASPGRLTMRATLVGWDDPDHAGGDADIQAEGIDLEPWKGLLEKLGGLAPAGGPLGLKLSAKVVEGKSSGRLEVSGGLQCRGWTVSDVAADLRPGRESIAIENGTASVNGGRVSLESFSMGLGPDARFSGALRIEGAAANYELAPFLAYVVPFLSLNDRKADFRGTIEGRLNLEGTVQDSRRSLRGQGMLRVRDGAVSASRFFQDAAKILGSDLEDILFSEMGSDFEIADEKVRCSKVFLVGKPGSKLRNIGLKGETGFDSRIDFGVDLAALQETVGSKRIRRILDTARKVVGDGVFPLKLKGTLGSPELAIDKSQGFPGLDAVLEEEKGSSVKDILDAIRSERRKDKDR
jgi:hypothetical protein